MDHGAFDDALSLKPAGRQHVARGGAQASITSQAEPLVRITMVSERPQGATRGARKLGFLCQPFQVSYASRTQRIGGRYQGFRLARDTRPRSTPGYMRSPRSAGLRMARAHELGVFAEVGPEIGCGAAALSLCVLCLCAGLFP